MDAQSLLDNLDVGLVAIAPDWTIVAWTASIAQITGLPAERMLGQNFWIAFPAVKGTHAEQILRDVLADGTPRAFVAPARTPELAGQVFEVRVTRSPHHHLVLLSREIREELAPDSRAAGLVAAFEQERRFYRQLFEALPIPALVLTVEGQVLEANRPATELLGEADTRSLGGRWLADWVPEPQRPALLAALRDARDAPQRLRVSIDATGQPVAEIDVAIENVVPGDERAKLVFLAVDVSRELLLQQRLVAADRLSQIGALVSGVAHELNNPLAAIGAFAQLLTMEARDPSAREAASVIHAEAMRAGRVVQTLLDFARRRASERRAVDLQAVTERVLVLTRSVLGKAGVHAAIQIPPETPAVMGDPQELQQVLLNAVINACQAIEATAQRGRIEITARRTDDTVVLAVEDTGPGVPAEILDRVFEPFFTTKGEQGTGLGLAVSLGLVKGMGGRLWIHNVEGRGARLAIELAIADAPAAPHPPAPVRVRGRRQAVLIVDDDPSVRRALVRLAERSGHRATAAASFAEAVRLLEAPNAAYDSIVVDVQLDTGHSGFELLDAVRPGGRDWDRRVIFTTGDSISVRTRDLLQRSLRPVLAKPFALEELRDILDRVGR
ncbi:MAG: ATP-binding protein [Gemmatimonadales bacterium]